MDIFYSKEEQTMIDKMAKNGVLVEWLSGLCPVQAQGWVDDKAFYFRARHDEWSISITKSEATDLDEALEENDSTWRYYEKYGEDPEAGYMPFIEALQFIESSAEKALIDLSLYLPITDYNC